MAETLEAAWLPTRFYSKLRDRVWAGVAYMFRAVLERTADRMAEQVPQQWAS